MESILFSMMKCPQFLQRFSIACYAERGTSYSKSVCLSLCLSVRPSHDSSYDHGVFTVG